jgi:DNA-binding MarR family transcriptional regulator
VSELETLFDEVRLLRNVLVEQGERLHARETVTLGMRALLEFLQRNGPTAVPDVARARHVSRQHIQTLANRLKSARLMQLVPNPAHERSALMTLTPVGEKLIARMKAREGRRYADTDFGVGAARVKAATETLRQVRVALEKEVR